MINDTIYCFVLKAYDENIFLAQKPNISSDGTIHRTTNGGQTWESFQVEALYWALDIEFIPGNPSNVWCGSESVGFSSDTGRTWINEIDFQNGNGILYDIVFTDENSGWIYAGGGGTLTHMYRTTNGGHGGIVSVDEELPVAAEFKLEQNYPNPFNPSTKIKFTIPASSLNPFSKGEGTLVTLKVYDVLGNEIATLVNEELSAGEYEVSFDSHSGEVRNLTSGVYIYTLKAGGFIQTKKMILMK
jgi:hypothetical protein